MTVVLEKNLNYSMSVEGEERGGRQGRGGGEVRAREGQGGGEWVILGGEWEIKTGEDREVDGVTGRT